MMRVMKLIVLMLVATSARAETFVFPFVAPAVPQNIVTTFVVQGCRLAEDGVTMSCPNGIQPIELAMEFDSHGAIASHDVSTGAKLFEFGYYPAVDSPGVYFRQLDVMAIMNPHEYTVTVKFSIGIEVQVAGKETRRFYFGPSGVSFFQASASVYVQGLRMTTSGVSFVDPVLPREEGWLCFANSGGCWLLDDGIPK